jgi:hypothetical protein
MTEGLGLVLTLRVVIALAGAVVFGYGIRVDSPTFRWGGIGLLVVALLLRFWRRDRRPD